jgi:hypothetical protein
MAPISDEEKLQIETETENELVEEILHKFQDIGIDTSNWEYEFGDGNFAAEFIQAGIQSHLEKLSLASQGWVSVEERLPEDGQLCLLWHKSQITYAIGNIQNNRFCFSHMYLMAVKEYGEPHENMAFIKDVNPQDITHWMLLPDKPKSL